MIGVRGAVADITTTSDFTNHSDVANYFSLMTNASALITARHTYSTTEIAKLDNVFRAVGNLGIDKGIGLRVSWGQDSPISLLTSMGCVIMTTIGTFDFAGLPITFPYPGDPQLRTLYNECLSEFFVPYLSSTTGAYGPCPCTNVLLPVPHTRGMHAEHLAAALPTYLGTEMQSGLGNSPAATTASTLTSPAGLTAVAQGTIQTLTVVSNTAYVIGGLVKDPAQPSEIMLVTAKISTNQIVVRRGHGTYTSVHAAGCGLQKETGNSQSIVYEGYTAAFYDVYRTNFYAWMKASGDTLTSEAAMASMMRSMWETNVQDHYTYLGTICRTSLAIGGILGSWTETNLLLDNIPPIYRDWLIVGTTNLDIDWSKASGGSSTQVKNAVIKAFTNGASIWLQCRAIARQPWVPGTYTIAGVTQTFDIYAAARGVVAGWVWAVLGIEVTFDVNNHVVSTLDLGPQLGSLRFIEVSGGFFNGAAESLIPHIAAKGWTAPAGNYTCREFAFTNASNMQALTASFVPWETAPPVGGTVLGRYKGRKIK